MLRCRNATDADFDLIFQIKKSSIKPHIEKIWGWDDAVQLNFHAKDFNPEITKILTDDSGTAVGLLIVTEDDKSIYLQNLLVCNTAQGKGAGTQILNDLIAQAKLKSKPIRLQVFKINIRAMALYQRLGFTVTGQTEHHYKMALGASEPMIDLVNRSQ